MSGFTVAPLINGLQQVLDLRTQQHSLTATNLANVDTPGYHAKVLDFENALREAVNAPSEILQLDTSVEGHMSIDGSVDPTVTSIEPPPWSVSDNSVLLERETARLVENATMYRGVATGLSRKLAILRYAASDGQG